MLRTVKGMNSVQPGGTSVHVTPELASVSNGSLWTGRIVSRIVGLFMIFDSVTKLVKSGQVGEATQRIGFPDSTIIGVGAVSPISTGMYMTPRTAIPGAILLTAHLGGAAAANVRVGSPRPLNPCFPIFFGILA
jgi:DoxX-like family